VPAALALAVLLSVPALAQDPYDAPAFHRSFVLETAKVLKTLKQTRAQAAFIEEKGIDLFVVSTGPVLPEFALAGYDLDRRRIFVNRVRLADSARQLEAAGLAPARIAEAAAWKWIPVVAHEIRHGMVKSRLRDKGIDFPQGTLEDEMIAFFDTVRVLQASLDGRPDLWTDDRLIAFDFDSGILLKEWRRSPSAVKELVAPRYPKAPSVLDMPRERMAALLKEGWDAYAKTLTQVDRYYAAAKTMKDPMRRQEALADPEAKATREDSVAMLGRARRSRIAIETTQGYERIRSFYRDELKRLVGKVKP